MELFEFCIDTTIKNILIQFCAKLAIPEALIFVYFKYFGRLLTY